MDEIIATAESIFFVSSSIKGVCPVYVSFSYRSILLFVHSSSEPQTSTDAGIAIVMAIIGSAITFENSFRVFIFLSLVNPLFNKLEVAACLVVQDLTTMSNVLSTLFGIYFYAC